MRFAIPVLAFAVAAASTVPVTAQDKTVSTRTNTKASDTKVIMMTGCVREDPITHVYTLVGTMAASEAAKSTTKAEPGAVGTTGSMATYPLLSPAEVELSTYVGKRVDVSVIKTLPTGSPAQSKTQGNQPRNVMDNHYTVVSVKPLAGSCS